MTEPGRNPAWGTAGNGSGRAGPGQGGTRPGGNEAGGNGKSGRIGLRTLRRVGPVVGEAMRANATLRAYSGFMIFFLAFLLRIVHIPGVNDKVALASMVVCATAGGFLASAVEVTRCGPGGRT